MIDALDVALQGLLRKTALAIAVQGLLDGEDEPDEPLPLVVPMARPIKLRKDTDDDVLLFLV